MLIGDARVSTAEQNLDLQRGALTQAGLLATRARGRHGVATTSCLRKVGTWPSPCWPIPATAWTISARRSAFRAPPCTGMPRR